MTDREIEQNIRTYIQKTPHMSLATVKDGKPWVSEVHFAADDELRLYFVSKPSTRHGQEIEVNPNVAGNIVKQHSLDESPHGVYFEGQAGAVDDPTTEQVSYYAHALGCPIEELTKFLYEDKSHKMYMIRVSRWAIFGKFGGDKNVKSELIWQERND